ncbi:MAG: T9SS C-terminal target domain-containing protein [Calditrichaeota bacterium]|nr:MAG: T9SS C-terminal target domain-containing protein [Calditrichota bacterium]
MRNNPFKLLLCTGILVLMAAGMVFGQTIIRPEPIATIEGVPGTNFRVGTGGFRVGDINGDSFPDLITRGDTRPSPNEPPLGCILVYYGDVTGGLSSTPDVKLFNPGAPAGTLEDPFANGFGGKYEVGDVNGDGFDDVAVGAISEWGITAAGDTITRAGAVYIFFGSANLSGNVMKADVRIGHPDYDRPGRYIDPNPQLRFSHRIDIGDYNNDGVDDMIVSEHGGLYSYIVKDASEAVDTVHALPDTVDNWSFRYFFKGPITQNDQAPDFKMGSYWHNTQGASHGTTTGDFNGDGIMDYLLSCYGAYDLNVRKGPATATAEDSARFARTEQYGKILIYFGGADLSGWSKFPDLIIPKQDTTRGELSQGTELMGYLFSRDGAKQGDYNGDGYTDIISSNIWPRGIFGYEAGLPLRWVFMGGPGIDNIADGSIGSTIDNTEKKWRMAWGGTVGDINGDGFDDYLFTSHVDSTDEDPITGKAAKGEYFLYLGGATVTDEMAAKVRPVDPRASSAYGLWTPVPLWDMDGDGISEWATIASAWGDSSQGKIYFLKGDAKITSVDSDPLNLLKTFSLEQNYPNPFNPSTQISYQLPVAGHVVLEIYNLMGQKITTLISKKQPAGEYTVSWDGTDAAGRRVSSGAYLYRLKVGQFTRTRKLVFLR